MMFHYTLSTLLIVVLTYPLNLAADKLFDAHLHYSAEEAAMYSPQFIIEQLDRNGTDYAIVTSTPANHAALLYEHAPERIVPFLGIYRTHWDKTSWQHDSGLPTRIKQSLKTGNWRGIGEIHIFASDRHSPVFRQIILLASQHQLPLMIHGDPSVIDTVYDIAPRQIVIWAHAGTFPYADLVADYLRRYPSLLVDLSVRDQQIAPLGQIKDTWYEVLTGYPDRFMIGVDTYSVKRWRRFGSVVKLMRNWLAQLPQDVARDIAYGNAARLFGKSACRHK